MGPGGPHRFIAVVEAGLMAARPELPEAIARYAALHPADLALALPPLVLPGGEEAKQDLAAVQAIWQAVELAGLDRHAYVLAVGGGALLDGVGFAAATAHRGVRLVRVPSTTLAQADAGVGVKNAINAFGQKNFIGTFAPPWAVLNDAELLSTLGERDWRAGAAEAVKVALIKDADFFAWLEAQSAALCARDLRAMAQLVRRCAALHLAHIAQGGDPFEQGSSRPLDCGHWAAHKLERLSAHRLRHGEAVAIGLALDATYAQRQGLLAEADWRRVVGLLLALGFSLACPELAGAGLLDGLEEFRAHLGGPLTVTLPAGIGRAVEVHRMDKGAIAEATQCLARVQAAWEGGNWRWAS
jgi:3-dehydroquinate synthase